MASGKPGFSQPFSFNYARSTLGETINNIIGQLNDLMDGRNVETITLNDTEKAALNDGDSVEKIMQVVDVTNHDAAIVHLQGGGNSVAILAQNGSKYGTSEGTDAQTNIYWDAGNSRYEIENQRGTGTTYDITHEGD